MVVENFFLGLVAVSRGLSFSVKQLVLLPHFQGFVFGFVLATILFAFFAKSELPSLSNLFFADPAMGFQKQSRQGKDGQYDVSYTKYKKLVVRARLALYVFIAAFFVAVIISLWKFS